MMIKTVFMIIFAIGWMTSLVEALTYRKMYLRLRSSSKVETLQNKEYEQVVQQQANVIERLHDRLEHSERLLDVWRERKR